MRRKVVVYSPLGQARNFLRAMKLEQEAFFYHSNCKEPGIAGLVKVSCIGIGLNPSPFRETYSCRYKGTKLKSVNKKEVPSSPSLMSPLRPLQYDKDYNKAFISGPAGTDFSFLCLGLSLKNRPDDSSSKSEVTRIKL